MNEWTAIGFFVGLFIGIFFGGAVVFGYISYRSYKAYIEYQKEMKKVADAFVPSSADIVA